MGRAQKKRSDPTLLRHISCALVVSRRTPAINPRCGLCPVLLLPNRDRLSSLGVGANVARLMNWLLTKSAVLSVMSQRNESRYLRLSDDAQAVFIAAARDGRPVRGLTHDFYKYPARFSPIFARAAIELFTRPGDLVLDPHVGGGTTLVEARAA